ncbi:LysR family transcriptional regulator [Bradyrhizobium sp. U87765 SZCCT0131]|uniref:LysR family transcriptional regulator n=1 Tax=unclassified Bradyrhizobium TaxID=2631580 RepID=UPI001BA631CA|nr:MULTISPECIES: LysR family transcriptional regulator [unclassified Bradyrhizobium]MBR1220575.1 LysR family transcriptional regulator [Bradyrhizobium sp. U87765 SZCCT0131]MBR1262971.1 LysR family transcriptional regulator [Bradyrhizobium sp. U87765 SZCCT0134]MBR1307147.1 LysR family transcriptional regulator [Bradyrhizobium sp. U87765 SZCCT0110]MBR1322966.1 LysR family transcriptional regulator [Bradyrhizobium sp. U87765 SZCCT0109]MBR1346101.1 LysR family transcriptional regulator [Bradyrhizo
MLDALTLDQIRTFVTVADSGSFRAAAIRLSRVQSAVSHAIANLEAELGVMLFDRAGHRPKLTPQGHALLANARDILLRIDAMRARAHGLGEGVELELSLTVDTLFPIATVGAALTEMRSSYPSVAIRLTVEPLGGPIAALLDKRSTLAITAGENFRDPRIVLDALGAIAMVAVVAARHPLATRRNGEDTSIPDLADHLQIVQSDPTPLSEGRDFGVLSPQTCRVGSQDTKHAMILAGLGWGRLPAWLIVRDLAEGRLVRVDTRALGRNATVVTEAYLAHRLDAPIGPAARAFRAALSRLAES